MKDVFKYEVQGRILGQMFDALILKPYMIRLLENRNKAIKNMAESKHLNGLKI